MAGIALAAGAATLLFRLFMVAKRRLLWRVRRKLILSYIFIGFTPVLLIVVFFLLCGFLLFYNFSSYLVQTGSARSATRRASSRQRRAGDPGGGGRDVADVLDRKRNSVAASLPACRSPWCRWTVPVRDQLSTGQSQLSGVTFRLETETSKLRAGPWSHVEPPATLPGWIDCAGFAGLLAYSRAATSGGQDTETALLVRAVAFPDSATPGYAVIVDIPVDDEVKGRRQRETGVEVKGVNAVSAFGRRRRARQRDGDGAADMGDVARLPRLELRRLPARCSCRCSSASADLRADSPRRAWSAELRSEAAARLLVIIGPVPRHRVRRAHRRLALAKSITGSVHELFRGTERVRQADFTHKIAIPADDQLGELAGSFNSMTASIEDLLRQAAEKKRLEEELRIAREIQMSLLPQGPLTMPGLSVTAMCVPAREVGGDYYDFLPLDEHRLGVLIADVSGKGTSAALYMAELKGLMLSLSEIHTSPRELLLSANRIIAANLDSRSFITMTYAVVDLDARTMTYARAGHTPLMFVPGPASTRRERAACSRRTASCSA